MTTTRNRFNELRLCSDHMLEHFSDGDDIAYTVPKNICVKCVKESEEMARENLEQEKAAMRCCENVMLDYPHICRKKSDSATAAQPVPAKVEERDNWIPCPNCGSDYNGALCLSCKNVAPITQQIMELMDATAVSGAYFTSEEFKQQLAAILRPYFPANAPRPETPKSCDFPFTESCTQFESCIRANRCLKNLPESERVKP